MAEGTSDGVKDFDTLVGRLDRWTEKLKVKDKCPLMLKYVECKNEELLGVSRILSDILPELKDDNNFFFEIDYILYPDQKWSDFETSQSVFYTKELFERIDMSKYLSSYYFEVKKYDAFDNILYDYTLLKVVKHIPEYPGCLGDISKMLLDSGNEKLVCFGLKFLKTVLEGNFAKYLQCRGLCSLVSNYKDIPTEGIKDPNKQKIASFIADLAKICYEKFEDIYKVPKENQSPKIKILNSIHYILYNCDDEMPIYQRNILYTIFTSVKDEETRLRYLEWLVRAIATSCTKNLFEGFKVLTCCVLGSVYNSESHIRENKMRLIDMDYGRNIEPYLTDVDVPIESKKLWNDEKNEDETDYTFEKFFFYDEVMKNLHLLKIFYAAASECNKICEGEFEVKDYTEAFRDDDYTLEHIGFFLINKDVKVPWYMEKTLEMCPFIIFPLEHKQLVFDLIRVLRREKQSEKLSDKIKEMEDRYNNRWKVGDPLKNIKKLQFLDD